MKDLVHTCRRLYRRQKDWLNPIVYAGLEQRNAPAEYSWDGLKRRGDPNHPYVVFQYTLDGAGQFTSPAGTQAVLPGMAFSAVVPSEHRYFLPAEPGHWLFFFFVIHQPYVVERMARQIQNGGAVVAIPQDSVLVARALNVFEGCCQNSFRDDIAREQALFEFLFEYERFARETLYTGGRRERLLEETRRFVQEHLSDPIDVGHLAERKSMSRSHFSHHFKATTGISPARFITETRLHEVSRRLLGTRDSLKTIAADIGFADANHLCKVFRRFFHISPGAFRRQMT